MWHFRTASYLKAVCTLIDKYKPEIILMGATGLGRDLAGAVATVVATGLTAGIRELKAKRSKKVA